MNEILRGLLKPPIAKKEPRTIAVHGQTLVDDYGWLRDKTSAETTAYLEAENAYAEAVMASSAELQQTLYDEMLGRIRQTDIGVPWRKGAYLYYSRTEEGKQYPIWARIRAEGGEQRAAGEEALSVVGLSGCRVTPDNQTTGQPDNSSRSSALSPSPSSEEIVLDVNQLAEGKEFMALGSLDVSDDANLLLFSTDDTGYRQYTLQVKDLRTGELLPVRVENTESLLWSADNRTFFYTVENDAKRQYRLYRHVLGTDVHELVYEEEDEAYDLYASRTRSGAWIVITSESKVTNESRLIPAATPEVEPRVMVPRRDGRRYYPDHRGDRFYILADDTGVNFRVVTAPLEQPARWTELVPHREPVMLEELSLFRDHMVLRVREHGLPEFEIYDLRKGDGFHRIAFPEPAYSAQPGVNEEFDTTLFRYTYESFVTPRSVYDYDMDAQTAVLLKRTECLGGYDPSRYSVERFFVTARDGAEVPVAMVYRNDVDPRAGNPLLLYGYGSYGSSIPDAFNSNRFSLIDRGITFAIAHIRGGGEMGEAWHDHGRMMEKKNTFHDFIDVAEELIARGYTSRETLAIQGGSAGGLLVGAVMNMRPELFKAVVAFVPFVDVMNTMLDASLPLTTQEYVEWGNPNEAEAFAYMRSYDPYSNVERKAYPAMLVRTSLNDSQVGYWEAAKWVARLRAYKTDENELLLHVNMGAGHGGASGRYDKLREQAFDYAWVLRMLGR